MSAAFAHGLRPLAAPKASTGRVRVNRPGDAHECEADRVADTVSRGGRMQGWSISNVGMRQVQRQPTPTQPAPQPNNYKEGVEKIGEAFLQTDVGKKLMQAVTDDPLVKAGESFIASLPGKIITGAAAVGAVAGLAAEHKGLPIQIPEIPLGKIRPSLEEVTVKITYEGPVDHPTQAMVVFSYSPSASKKKPAQTDTERNRAETARIAADQDKFRAGMTYKPGTPQAEQQAADQKMFDDYTLHRFGSLPGTGGKPLVAPGLVDKQPDTGLRLPEFHSPFERKSPALLDQKLELTPMDAATASAQAQDKKEEVAVQRKAVSDAAVMDGGGGVDAMPNSPGMPLDRQTRSFMESHIGFDFSKVKIHADPQAAVAAKGMGALAYTVGDNIVFGAGQYSPETSEGKKLIAHELTHTIQQRNYAPVSKLPFPAKTAQRSRNISLGQTSEKKRSLPGLTVLTSSPEGGRPQ